MRITMIGTGYVGLVSGTCFADFGHDVTCVDLNAGKIAALENGEIPIYEPGLDSLVATNTAAGRLQFTTELAPAVAQADIVFIAVGTPTRKSDGAADLSYVHAAAAEIGKAISGFTVIVTKSTVPVGTGDEIEQIIRQVNPAANFAVVSNPEFLREGAAIDDFQRPDRIVIGLEDERARPLMEELYAPLHDYPIMFVGRRTAELTKYAGNAFLAMKITFMNEMADLCEKVGADVSEVARGIGLDSRIGEKFLNAGPGYGGSCFPKDTMALAKTGQDYGSPLRLVETTVKINDRRKYAMAQKVVAAVGGDVRGKRVAVLGLTFKPDTDDMRDAPSISIIRALQEAGATICAYDPEGMEASTAFIQDVRYANNAYEAAAGVDCVVLVTEWKQFRTLDLDRLGAGMRDRNFVDLRNIYRGADLAAHGFAYLSIGRPAQDQSPQRDQMMQAA